MLATLRTRLLLMILVVMAPAAVFIAIEARTTYDTALRALHESQAMVATNASMRIRLDLESSGRVLTTLTSAAASSKDEHDCDTVFARALPFAPGMVAVRARRSDGVVCQAVETERRQDAPALYQMLDKADFSASAGDDFAGDLKEIRFGSAIAAGVRYLIATIGIDGEGQKTTGEIVIDLSRLPEGLGPVQSFGGATLALFDHSDLLLLVRGYEKAAVGWLPAAAPSSLEPGNPVALAGRDGKERSYVLAQVTGPNLFVVAGFDRAPQRAVFRQFMALLLAPLATMLALWLAYSRMIRTHVLRWTNGLAAAARDITANRAARAPDEPGMPQELREVGQSFNAMIERQEIRERTLEAALEHNQHLTRELHHRIKNSLQIVQSYIGLGKRRESGPARAALLRAEARVNALSTAYRLALADGELKDAPVDAYLEAVANNIGTLLLGPGQHIHSELALGTESRIDRLTPLGLILVESLITLLATGDAVSVTVSGERKDDGTLTLTIKADRPGLADDMDHRLLDGLIQQAEAEHNPLESPGTLLSLRLKPDA
jgi:two-component sensor histidine kinase